MTHLITEILKNFPYHVVPLANSGMLIAPAGLINVY